MKRKKLPYFIRLMRVSLKWTWRAFMMIGKEMLPANNSRRNRDNTGNVAADHLK